MHRFRKSVVDGQSELGRTANKKEGNCELIRFCDFVSRACALSSHDNIGLF